ncbi:unnamed protein product, partial [Effrenium voratum]
SFNALELFPHDTLDAEAQQSAVTLTLALLQRTAKTVELLQSWFRLCYKGPQNWRTLPTTKLALERRLRFAREILAKNSVNLQITDEEFMALDLQRIGTGVGPPTIVPLCFALLNHSCCPNVATELSTSFSGRNTRAVFRSEEDTSFGPRGNVSEAKLIYRGCQGSLTCMRPIEAGEEIFISYINEVDEVLSRR